MLEMLLKLQMMGEFFLKFMYWMESEPAFSTLQKEVGLMVGLVHCSAQWSYPDKIRVFDSIVHVLLQRYTSEKNK